MESLRFINQLAIQISSCFLKFRGIDLHVFLIDRRDKSLVCYWTHWSIDGSQSYLWKLRVYGRSRDSERITILIEIIFKFNCKLSSVHCGLGHSRLTALTNL